MEHIAPPDVYLDEPTRLLVTAISYDDYKGKIVIGRVHSGTFRKGQPVARIDHGGAATPAKIAQVFSFQGLTRQEVEHF